MVVTDTRVLSAGMLDRIIDCLKAAQIPTLVYSEVEANPSAQTVDRVAAKAAEAGVDVIIAIGGGSSIDALTHAIEGYTARCANPLNLWLCRLWNTIRLPG